MLDLVADVLDRAALLPPAPVGDDAVRAELVTSVDDRHERGHGIGLSERRGPELTAAVIDAGDLHDRREILRPRERVDVWEAAAQIVVARADHAAHDGDLEAPALRPHLLQPAQLA